MKKIELRTLNEYKELPIPNSIYESEKSIKFIYIMFHAFYPYLNATLNGNYLDGFKKNDFLSIKRDCKNLLNKISGSDAVEVQHYFDLYFKAVDIVDQNLTK